MGGFHITSSISVFLMSLRYWLVIMRCGDTGPPFKKVIRATLEEALSPQFFFKRPRVLVRLGLTVAWARTKGLPTTVQSDAQPTEHRAGGTVL